MIWLIALLGLGAAAAAGGGDSKKTGTLYGHQDKNGVMWNLTTFRGPGAPTGPGGKTEYPTLWKAVSSRKYVTSDGTKIVTLVEWDREGLGKLIEMFADVNKPA